MAAYIYSLGLIALGEIPAINAISPYYDVIDPARAKRRDEAKRKRFGEKEEEKETVFEEEDTISEHLHPYKKVKERLEKSKEKLLSAGVAYSPMNLPPNQPVLPTDQIVHSMQFNIEQERHRKLMQMLMDDENDIEMLLRGH